MKKIIILLSAALLISTSIFACRVTLVNDSSDKLFAIDDLVGRGYMIKKGKKAFFGEKTRRPVIKIFRQDKDSKAYLDVFTVRQVSCTGNKEVTLKMSEIINTSYNNQLFNVQPRQVDGAFIGTVIKQ